MISSLAGCSIVGNLDDGNLSWLHCRWSSERAKRRSIVVKRMMDAEDAEARKRTTCWPPCSFSRRDEEKEQTRTASGRSHRCGVPFALTLYTSSGDVSYVAVILQQANDEIDAATIDVVMYMVCRLVIQIRSFIEMSTAVT